MAWTCLLIQNIETHLRNIETNTFHPFFFNQNSTPIFKNSQKGKNLFCQISSGCKGVRFKQKKLHSAKILRKKWLIFPISISAKENFQLTWK
jgi:hypothetical protein